MEGEGGKEGEGYEMGAATADVKEKTEVASCFSPVRRSGAPGRHQRTGSFMRWKRQMQRAWKWGASGNGQEQGYKTTVNLEAMANQKRQWYQIHSRPMEFKQKEPTSFFEHFFIVGLHSYGNSDAIEDAFVKRKTWESDVAKSEILDLRKLQHQGRPPLLEPQILFKYPPGKKLEMREKDLPAFCFPGGVKTRLIQRTASMSDLNEVVFGQEHLEQDDQSFIFCLKDSNNTTLYGVCLHVQEIVQRAPGILGNLSPSLQVSGKLSRFLVSAPRCYCLLTRVPYFELHYEMLNSLIAQERLERITQFVNEMVLGEPVPHGIKENEQIDVNFDSPINGSLNNWMDSVVPIDNFSSQIGASAGLSSDGDFQSLSYRSSDAESPESITHSDSSDFSHGKEIERNVRKFLHYTDDFASEGSESCFDGYENGQISPISYTGSRLHRIESLESIYSSVRSTPSDGEDDEVNMKYDRSPGDEKVMEWAKANNNESLQIVCGYHLLPLPKRGSEVIFHPLEHLQPIKYFRPATSSLGLGRSYSSIDLSYPSEIDVVNARLASAEEALALSLWTTATVCRALSLESILTLFSGTLLEKQVVVISPNLGVLSSIVLSLIPMIQPFEYQSLLLPVLPRKMHDFLDAPVPFIVGIQHKPTVLKIKTTKGANFVRVNVQKDEVKACSLPILPQYKELVSELSPHHAILSNENPTAKRHPTYKCNEVQAEAARQFLIVTRNYLESICSDLRSHTITNVQSNDDRVSLLLKESFIDSFPARDRPFIKLFVETQLFSVLSDSRLSSFENERV